MSKPSPTSVRESLCEDLAKLDRKAGRIPNTRLIESIVNKDIADYEGRKRAAKPRPAKKDGGGVKQRLNRQGIDKDRPGEHLAQKLGGKFRRNDSDNDTNLIGSSFTPVAESRCQCRFQGTCKRCKMATRIGRCLERHPGKARAMDWKYPHLAVPLVAAYIRRMWGRGEYADLRPVDRDRMFLRKMQDVCDASTGALGPWWVK